MLLLFAAIGPEVGYPFNVGKHQWYANMRDYYESWVHVRILMERPAWSRSLFRSC